MSATLVFADGSVAVGIGCNSGSGTAAITDTTITFVGPSRPRDGLPGTPGGGRGLMTQVLAGEVTYEIDAGSLTVAGLPAAP